MRSKIIEKLFLIIGDVIVVLLAFIAAYYLRLGTFSRSEFLFSQYIKMAAIMLPLWVLILAYQGRYSLFEKSLSEHFKIALLSSVLASVLFPMMFYFTNERFFSRGIIFLLFILATLFLFTLSYFFRKYSQRKASQNSDISRMLVIGANKSAEKIIGNLIENSSFHKPVAILTPYGSRKKELFDVPVLGKLDALEKVFQTKNIDEVFLCEGIEHSENLSSFCRNKGIPLRTSFETLGISHDHTQAETIEGTTFLTIYQSPLFGWGQFYKRVFDIVVAGIGVIIFSPYFLLHRKNLTQKKFKKGISENDIFDGYIFFNPDTKTYYGHNISLLLNVLKKDMSMVGPKALTSREYEEIFKGKEEQSAIRFILRPGIFSPHRFECLTPEKILRSEILYIKNWTFVNDIRILLRELVE